jgi:protein involved in polysaccharide export with SLBB domain
MKKIILLLMASVFCFALVVPAVSQDWREDEKVSRVIDYEIATEEPPSVTTLEDVPIGEVRTLSDVQYLEYAIRPHIILHIELAGEGKLADPGLDVRVSPSGHIKYPYVGKVDVMGLTEDQAARKLEKLLEKDYVRAPQVTVTITGAPKYYILGKINRPGMYGMVLDREITLVEAMMLAGGIKKVEGLYREGWAVVRVIRTEEGERREYAFQVDSVDESFTVQPDDIIVLEYGKRLDLGSYHILGEITRPGRYPIVSEEFSAKKIQRWDVLNLQYITLLGAANVIDAINVAQGLTPDAARNYVRVRRKVGKTWYGKDKYKTYRVPVGHIYYTGDMRKNLSLKDGDVITIPESWF